MFGSEPLAQTATPLPGDAAGEPDTAETEVAPEPLPSAIVESTPLPAAKPPIPAGCESLYSPSMVAQLQGYGVVLNPAWARAELAETVSLEDPELVNFVTSRPNLQCLWVTPGGGSGMGIETRIVPVTAEEDAVVQARLANLGYDRIAELGGTRYVFGVAGSEFGAAYGESHIVVGGYWFATSWLELGITGYTADMVTTLLG